LRELVARLALAAGERKAASRGGLLSEKVIAGVHQSIDPRRAKPAAGSNGPTPRHSECQVLAVHAGGEQVLISGGKETNEDSLRNGE